MQSALRDIHAQRLLILDFGSQYTQLIARRVRECGVYCEIYPFDISADDINAFAPAGVILSGSPETVTEGATPRIPESIFALGVPVLGICYGLQAMASSMILAGVQSPAQPHRSRAKRRISASPLSVWVTSG